MKKGNWIIFDIDGTLANIKHRLHYIQGEKKDWDGFNSQMLSDELKLPIFELYYICANAGYNIAIITGRFEKYRMDTLFWLSKNNIHCDELHMRPNDDYSSDYIIKEMIWEKHFKNRNVVFVVDDRQRVVDMWREKGLTVLQCQKGDY